MKYHLIYILAFVFVMCQAQDVTDEINHDVWFPFMESYATLNTEAFMGLHTTDVIRVNRDGQRLLVGEDYAESVGTNNLNNQQRGIRRTIAFSFIDRLHTDDTAYEVGYYRVRSASGGLEQLYYGKFHVVLKKVGTTWKIAVDSDSSHGGSITEEHFMSGQVLEHPVD